MEAYITNNCCQHQFMTKVLLITLPYKEVVMKIGVIPVKDAQTIKSLNYVKIENKTILNIAIIALPMLQWIGKLIVVFDCDQLKSFFLIEVASLVQNHSANYNGLIGIKKLKREIKQHSIELKLSTTEFIVLACQIVTSIAILHFWHHQYYKRHICPQGRHVFSIFKS